MACCVLRENEGSTKICCASLRNVFEFASVIPALRIPFHWSLRRVHCSSLGVVALSGRELVSLKSLLINTKHPSGRSFLKIYFRPKWSPKFHGLIHS